MTSSTLLVREASERRALLRQASAGGLAVLTGLLYSLAFPGLDLWPLAFIAFVPLLVAVEGRPARSAAVLGAVAGFTMNAVTMYWLYGTLRAFAGLAAPWCVLAALSVSTFQGGRIALFAGLGARARAKGWPYASSWATAFVASELVYPLLFPWYFGACAHRAPWLAQGAELGGPYLVGLLLFTPNLGVAELVVCRSLRRGPALGFTVATLAVPAIAALLGAARLRTIDRRVANSTLVRVGLVQGDVPLVPTLLDGLKAFHRQLDMTDGLRERGAELVIWGESALRDVPNADFATYIERFARGRLKVPTVVGAVLADSHRRAFNAAVLLGADGRVRGRYDKRYLVPLGEYLPGESLLPRLRSLLPNLGAVIPGTSAAPLRVGGHSMTVVICYEAIHPAFVNEAVSGGPSEMLVNLTNDGWFGDTTEPSIHLALATMRAIEHRRYLVRATNSGISAVVDPGGRVSARGRLSGSDSLTAPARWMHAPTTGYEIWGDRPWWILSGAACVMAFMRRPRNRARDRQ